MVGWGKVVGLEVGSPSRSRSLKWQFLPKLKTHFSLEWKWKRIEILLDRVSAPYRTSAKSSGHSLGMADLRMHTYLSLSAPPIFESGEVQ